MTAFTTTITNYLTPVGPGPATLWDATTSIWDLAKWGDGTIDILTNVQKLISESQGSTTSLLNFSISKVISESESLNSSVANTPFKLLLETQTMSVRASSEMKGDGTVWDYDFAPLTSNFVSMATATFTLVTNNSTVWTSGTTNVIGWS